MIGAPDDNLHPKEIEPNDFNSANTQELDLSGHPIYDEHNTFNRVGRVLRSFTGNDKTKFILGRLENKQSQDEVRDGVKRELSMTHHFRAQIKDDGTEIQTRVPMEVSLTKAGNRKNCDIIYHFDRPMSAPVTPPAVAAPVAAPAPAPVPAPVAVAESTADFETMNSDDLLKTLVAENMPINEAYQHIINMTMRLRAAEGTLGAQTQDLEALKRSQNEAAVNQHLATLQESGVAVTDAMRNSYMDMANRFPQQLQMEMVNTEKLASNSKQMLTELNALREQNARRREKKGLGAYLHRVGTASQSKFGPSGVFNNSVYERQVETEIPAFKRAFVSQLDGAAPPREVDTSQLQARLLATLPSARKQQ